MGGQLEKNKFIQNCSAVFPTLPPRLSLLVGLWCDVRIYQRGEIVYYCHDHAWNIFLVYGGVFAALAIATPSGGISSIAPADLNAAVEASICVSRRPNTGQSANWGKMGATPKHDEATMLSPYRLFTSRNFFGDAEVVLKPGPRRACHRCESKNGSLLVLSKKAMLDLLQEFPSCNDAWHVASKRKAYRDKSMLKLLTRAPLSRPPDEHRINGWLPY